MTKIYQPDSRTGRRTVFVQPGTHYPASCWMDEEGKPRMYPVLFVQGVAEVPENLADYMVEQELASRSPIIIPNASQVSAIALS
ncbi:hypothetical protein [Herbaspirillum frisingense]|uniref:hypothetical protein n=1 Tax=Herbaspirillum frisingense TaxID=92645 RepID=UPI0039B0017B